MNVFFAPPEDVQGEIIQLTNQEAHHALHVLRIKTGQSLWVTDGHGHRYETQVEYIDKNKACLRIQKVHVVPIRSLPVLAVGMIKQRERLEWLIEKSVELGISSLILMHTDHSERSGVREDRVRQIQISAMKQCLSDWLPGLEVGIPFNELLERYASRYQLVAHEKATQIMSTQHIGDLSKLVLYIGPEGGFSDREMEVAEKKGAHPWWLGSHRLRAETAAIAALSWLRLSKLP